MGKGDFKGLCKRAREEIGAPLTLKISAFSDTYDSSKSYAGMIIYAVDGKFQWVNTDGDAKGYKGRSFYFGILDTSKYPAGLTREVGQGRVHHHLILKLTGREFHQDTVCCGGFAFHEGKLKFSSVWLNGRHQTPKDSFGASDGDKNLSSLEKELCKFAVDQWQTHGVNKAYSLPDSLALTLGVSEIKKVPEKTVSTPRTPARTPSSAAVWEWQGSDGSWHPYDATSTATLERAYSSSSAPFTMTVARDGGSVAYSIDLNAMTQTYGTGTRYKRNIRRTT